MDNDFFLPSNMKRNCDFGVQKRRKIIKTRDSDTKYTKYTKMQTRKNNLVLLYIENELNQ